MGDCYPLCSTAWSHFGSHLEVSLGGCMGSACSLHCLYIHLISTRQSWGHGSIAWCYCLSFVCGITMFARQVTLFDTTCSSLYPGLQNNEYMTNCWRNVTKFWGYSCDGPCHPTCIKQKLPFVCSFSLNHIVPQFEFIEFLLISNMLTNKH